MEGKAVGVFSFEELSKIIFINDDVVRFIEGWELALANLEKEPDEDVLETLVIALLKRQKLKTDVAHWYRLQKDHPDRKYQWLIACAKREIRRDRQNYVRQQIETALAKPKIPAVPGTPKGKGPKGRGRGDGSGGGKVPLRGHRKVRVLNFGTRASVPSPIVRTSTRGRRQKGRKQRWRRQGRQRRRPPIFGCRL